MPIIIILLLIILAIGYSFSSILGVVVSGSVYGVFSYLFYKYEEEKDTPMYFLGKLSFLIPLIIILTTPIWDEGGYCSHQIERNVVGYERSFEDFLKGEKEQEIVRYTDISDRCLQQGGWEYAGGWSISENVRVLFIYLIGAVYGLAILVVLFIVLAAAKEAGLSAISKELYQFLTRTRDEDVLRNFAKEESKAIRQGNLMEILEERAKNNFKDNHWINNDWSVGLNILGVSYYHLHGKVGSPGPNFISYQFHGEGIRNYPTINKDKVRASELALLALNSFDKITPTEFNTLIKIREGWVNPKYWLDNKEMRDLAQSEAHNFSQFLEEIILKSPNFQQKLEKASDEKEARKAKRKK